MNKNNFMSTDVHTVSIVNDLTTEVIAFHAIVDLRSALPNQLIVLNWVVG